MVTAGAGYSMIDSELSSDHLNEALPRIDELGKKYVIVPSTMGDFVKVVGMTYHSSKKLHFIRVYSTISK
jgi:hypothetical protein